MDIRRQKKHSLKVWEMQKAQEDERKQMGIIGLHVSQTDSLEHHEQSKKLNLRQIREGLSL